MLEEILNEFFPNVAIGDISELGHGHINDTYLINLQNKSEQYVLQRINTKVFNKPEIIIHSHMKIQEKLNGTKSLYGIAKLFPTNKNMYLHYDESGNAWRLTNYIKESKTIEVVTQSWQAFEAGSAYGWFADFCSSLDVNKFEEPIKNFHKLSFRIGQLDLAIRDDKAGRLNSVIDLINFYKNREASLSQIESLVETGEIPLRIVHNDTKINNLLFRKEKAIAVIDLDTVGPGILFYDYGDALRTSANTSVEDEVDLSKVEFWFDAFEAFTLGYLCQVKKSLSTEEQRLLYKAPVLMTYIMGIRFLADYLNGDTYYKTSYPDHNLIRTRVQKKLIESMETQEEMMKKAIYLAINSKTNQSINVLEN
jgi:thiamine kinase-like enzyme